MQLLPDQARKLSSRIEAFDETAYRKHPQTKQKSFSLSSRQKSKPKVADPRIVMPDDPPPLKGPGSLSRSSVSTEHTRPRKKTSLFKIRKKSIPEPAYPDFASGNIRSSSKFRQFRFSVTETNVEAKLQGIQRLRTECDVPREIPEVECRVWRVDNREMFVHPEAGEGDVAIAELKAKPNFGIAVSGGSMRAMCCGMGWLRGLEMLDVLRFSRYLSSNSGGSFVCSVYSFQSDFSSKELLGPYLPPTMCAVNLLDGHKQACAFGGVLERSRGIVTRFARSVIEGRLETAISEALCGSFLGPFNLDDNRGMISVAGISTIGTESEHQVREYKFDTAKPFPIINCSIILPNDEYRFHPFEFTPLYCGSISRRSYNGKLLGGCLVEPIGFNSNRPHDLDDLDLPEGKVTCPPHDLVCLQGMVGASSSFLSVAMQEMSLFEDLPFAQEFSYWTPHCPGTQKLPFSDGGGIDNLGVCALLRRRVSKIISLVATNETNHITPNEGYMFNMADLAMLFGCLPADFELFSVSGIHLNQRNQVFPRSGFAELQKNLASCQRRGEPLVHCASYPVLANEFMGVEGGWEVSVMFVFNGPCAKWERQLPKETRAVLERDRSSAAIKCAEMYCTPGSNISLHEFPCVSSSEFKYSPRMVAMLGNMSSWVIQDVKEKIQTLLSSGFS